MPISHVFEEFSLYGLIDNIPQNYVEQLGFLFMTGPGTFMMCLGFGIVFSKNSTPKKLFIRGLFMFGIQFILNISRFILPHFLVGNVLNQQNIINDGLNFFLYSDILPFAGFTFIFFAIVKMLNLSKHAVLSFGILCTAGQMLIPQIHFEETYKNLLCGYFFYIDKTSFFPFISWIFFPIMGYLLGNKLIQTEKKASFYIKLGGISFIVFLATNFYLIRNGLMNSDFYCFMETGFRMDFWTTIISASTIGMYTCIIYFISKLIKENFANLITVVSKNINSIYCIHWAIVKWFWAFAMLFAIKIEYSFIFMIGLVIFIISALLANLWKNRQKIILP